MASKATHHRLSGHPTAEAWERLTTASDVASFVLRLDFVANCNPPEFHEDADPVLNRARANELLDHAASALARGLLLSSQLERNRLLSTPYELYNGILQLINITEINVLLLIEDASELTLLNLAKRVTQTGLPAALASVCKALNLALQQFPSRQYSLTAVPPQAKIFITKLLSLWLELAKWWPGKLLAGSHGLAVTFLPAAELAAAVLHNATEFEPISQHLFSSTPDGPKLPFATMLTPIPSVMTVARMILRTLTKEAFTDIYGSLKLDNADLQQFVDSNNVLALTAAFLATEVHDLYNLVGGRAASTPQCGVSSSDPAAGTNSASSSNRSSSVKPGPAGQQYQQQLVPPYHEHVWEALGVPAAAVEATMKLRELQRGLVPAGRKDDIYINSVELALLTTAPVLYRHILALKDCDAARKEQLLQQNPQLGRLCHIIATLRIQVSLLLQPGLFQHSPSTTLALAHGASILTRDSFADAEWADTCDRMWPLIMLFGSVVQQQCVSQQGSDSQQQARSSVRSCVAGLLEKYSLLTMKNGVEATHAGLAAAFKQHPAITCQSLEMAIRTSATVRVGYPAAGLAALSHKAVIAVTAAASQLAGLGDITSPENDSGTQHNTVPWAELSPQAAGQLQQHMLSLTATCIKASCSDRHCDSAGADRTLQALLFYIKPLAAFTGKQQKEGDRSVGGGRGPSKRESAKASSSRSSRVKAASSDTTMPFSERQLQLLVLAGISIAELSKSMLSRLRNSAALHQDEADIWLEASQRGVAYLGTQLQMMLDAGQAPGSSTEVITAVGSGAVKQLLQQVAVVHQQLTAQRQHLNDLITEHQATPEAAAMTGAAAGLSSSADHSSSRDDNGGIDTGVEPDQDELQEQHTVATDSNSGTDEYIAVRVHLDVGLLEQLQQLGTDLCAALPMPYRCNNPSCCTFSDNSEQEMVRGTRCVCGGCQVARYCGKECQTAHWKQHKNACQVIKKQRQESVTAARLRASVAP